MITLIRHHEHASAEEIYTPRVIDTSCKYMTDPVVKNPTMFHTSPWLSLRKGWHDWEMNQGTHVHQLPQYNNTSD